MLARGRKEGTQMLIEQISLGQIIVSLTFIIGIITTRKKIKEIVDEWFKEKLSPKIDPIGKNINELSKKIDDLELETYKSYLVLFMAQVERGEKPDEVEIQLFDEIYEKYTKKGGNSYIHRKYNKLVEEGKF